MAWSYTLMQNDRKFSARRDELGITETVELGLCFEFVHRFLGKGDILHLIAFIGVRSASYHHRSLGIW